MLYIYYNKVDYDGRILAPKHPHTHMYTHVAAAGNKPKGTGAKRARSECRKRDVDDYFTLLMDGRLTGRQAGLQSG